LMLGMSKCVQMVWLETVLCVIAIGKVNEKYWALRLA
jgi:hypothetical protein